MATRNELFKAALDYLYDNGKVAGQRELSALTGITETTISRILNNHVKQPSEDTIRKLNQAFGNIFNVGYFRGEDVPMIKDTESSLPTHELAQPSIDPSSAVNAAITAYVELTNRLKQEMSDRLADKDTIIAEKQARIVALEQTVADKDAIIRARDASILELERKIANLNASDLSSYPFAIGAAEPEKRINVSPYQTKEP